MSLRRWGRSAGICAIFLQASHAGGLFRWQWLSELPEPPSLHAAAVAAAQGPSAEVFEVPAVHLARIREEQRCERHGWRPRRGPPVQVIDAFLFHRELDLLEARLRELYHWVNAFTIVELGVTHQGTPRDFVFAGCLADPGCLDRFAPFLDKVIFFFVGSLPECEVGEAWRCESAHRDTLLRAFVSAGGGPHDMAIIGDADEFPRASTAWALSVCHAPEKVNIQTDMYYYSAHCRMPWADMRLKAVSGRVLARLGAQAVRRDNNFHIGESGWANISDGGFHLAYFMTPQEAVQKIQSFLHGEMNRYPFSSPHWHLDNARSCTFSAAWVHYPGGYVRTADIKYPRVPWYAVEEPERMWRFYAYARPGDEAAVRTAKSDDSEIAVCITGQLRGQVHWLDLRAVTHAHGLPPDVFAVVPSEDCDAARKKLDPRRVSCVPDLPLSPEEEHFARHGPQIDFVGVDHRRAHVLQHRLVSRCGPLLREAEHARGRRYRWVLRKRADVFLRACPRPDELPERALFVAYRDKELHLGGLNDKVWLGPPDLMRHAFQFYEYMLDTGSWPALRWLCSLATFGRPVSRYYVSALANVTGPAEAILQNYLLARGVPVRAHRGLRYDRADGAEKGEVSSPEPLPGPTGIFGAGLNPDGHSNAYPRDPYLIAPLLNVVLHDQELTKPPRKLVVLDLGCGTGFLVKELLVWKVSAFGVDGSDVHLPLLGAFGSQADLAEELGLDSHVANICGLLRRPNVSAVQVMGEGAPLPQDFNVNVTPDIADWVVSIDVGSHIPREHHRSFLMNLVTFAGRGLIVRWGDGPHGMEMAKLEDLLNRLGFFADEWMERHFALFSGIVGPSRGPVRVFAFEKALPGGVLGPPPHAPVLQESVEHVLATSLAHADPFEPNRQAAHFTEGEQVWQDGEVEILVGILRLWRAYLHPWEADEVLAPLRLRVPGSGEGLAWGNVTWEALATASWDASELLRMHLVRNASVLAGLATAEEVAWLSARREEGCHRCPAGVAWEARPLFSPQAGNGLAMGHGLAVALALDAPPGDAGTGPPTQRRPLGLHRQVWLNRLATRFAAG